jgi:hypothetical protein
VGLVEDDHVVKAFAADRADEPFDVRILPGGMGYNDPPISDVNRCESIGMAKRMEKWKRVAGA